uniref:Putative secreted protein n=1 Tax=Anopheles triannulatus TaxID=58253 RepID=A0A2M4B328_9DIPT
MRDGGGVVLVVLAASLWRFGPRCIHAHSCSPGWLARVQRSMTRFLRMLGHMLERKRRYQKSYTSQITMRRSSHYRNLAIES